MRISTSFGLFFLTLGIVGGFMAFVPHTKKPKVVKGTFHPKSALINAERGKICSIDSGGSEVIFVSEDYKNPLFESVATNRIYMHLEFVNGIESGKKYYLPDSTVRVCYYEKGDLLMFHTFQAEGSIQFDMQTSPIIRTGKIDLKFVRPHHNMSNSDYHYMGGKLQLKSK